MGKKDKVRTYHNCIEDIIIENIQKSNKEILIAMAWFTSNEIKNALIDLKDSNPSVDIQIVVDDNAINEKYFLNYLKIFQQRGIVIHKKRVPNFLHNKFMIVDKKTTLMGSYNYSKKARTNKENIAVIRSKKISSNYSRIFRFLTDENYIDPNIQLLLKYPEFAQKLLSTYYKFTKTEFNKYKQKIAYGACYTHDNGFCDEISYSAGFIFNPKVLISAKNIDSEFPLPINKKMIKEWLSCRNINLVLDSYADSDHSNYQYIDDDIKESQRNLKKYFKRKLKSTYKTKKIEKLINQNIDIIIEDRLWCDNFELFLNKRIVNLIFDNIDIIKKYDFLPIHKEIPF